MPELSFDPFVPRADKQCGIETSSTMALRHRNKADSTSQALYILKKLDRRLQVRTAQPFPIRGQTLLLLLSPLFLPQFTGRALKEKRREMDLMQRQNLKNGIGKNLLIKHHVAGNRPRGQEAFGAHG